MQLSSRLAESPSHAPGIPSPRGGPLPSDMDILARQAFEAVEEAARVRSQVMAQQHLGHQRRSALQARVTEAIRAEAERLWGERAALEAEFVESMRRVHDLEVSGMTISQQRCKMRVRAAHLDRVLKHIEQADLGDEVRELRGVGRHYDAKAQSVEETLLEAHREKDDIESNIMRRRHSAALTEALYRARVERAGPLMQQRLADLTLRDDSAGTQQRSSH